MNTSPSVDSLPETDQQLAATLARQAGDMLSRLQASAIDAKIPPGELKDLGDDASQQLLAGALSKARPSDAVLSEEAQDNSRRLHAERVWIIDPLDGTREFSEGRADWAVHVALWVEGELTVGAVALPGLGLVLDAKMRRICGPRTAGVLKVAASRTRPSELVKDLAGLMSAELVPMGSAGYKVGAVIRGEVDAYVHSGGQYEWDSAAPVAVAMACGLHASRIDGSPLAYNQMDPYLPDLLVCHKEMAAEFLDNIKTLWKPTDTQTDGLTQDGMYSR